MSNPEDTFGPAEGGPEGATTGDTSEDPAPTSTPTDGRPKHGPKAAKTARLMAMATDRTRPANEQLRAIKAVLRRVQPMPPQRTEHVTTLRLPDGRVVTRTRVTEG